MKFSKLDLLTLLISLFLFASCNESNTLGLDLDPDDAIQGALVDSVTVKTKTVADEVTSTFFSVGAAGNPVRIPFGYFKDPLFGTSEASLALSVNLPSSAYSFGTNAMVDSAVLVLPYSTQFYGDTTTSVYSVNVQQLTKNLSTETSFLSNREWEAQTEIAGTFTGRIKPNTPFKITAIVAAKPDTLKAVPASLRIKLSNAFIKTNILDKGTTVLLNDVTFNSSFKGLKVSINKANSTGTGGVMFFDFNKGNASIEVYYTKQNATTTTAIDTAVALFPINQKINPVAATIKHNYTGTPVATQLADATNKQYEATYLQPLAGVRNKISFPYLKQFVKNLGAKIIINKAELVVDLSTGNEVAPFVPAQSLALYQYDIAGQRALIPDQNSSDFRYIANFGGGYNIGTKNYTFIVTGLLQDLIDGKSIDNGFYLAPAPNLLAEYGIMSPITTANRSVIGAFNNATNKIKLNIYYTKIN
ncbi:hypothetical protein AAKU52_000456 [Pedobacter sp. CG_S7]|uniref:DUF4270 domain-containing protein n=1 Tax=Pedobacter sp. CG_S7 TaxID=3143930 RepID=UPI0033931F6A